MRTVTRYGVELAKPGAWKASVGNGTLTATDIADMAAFAQHPESDRIRIKIGHGKPVPGAPAYGVVRNVRVGEGDLLLGDLEIPEEVDALLGTVYPDRSIEFVRGLTTSDGKRHPISLQALSLLGEEPPAVKGLTDFLPPEFFKTENLLASGEQHVIEFTAPMTTMKHSTIQFGMRPLTNGGHMATLTPEQMKTAGLTDAMITALSAIATEQDTEAAAIEAKRLADEQAATAKAEADAAIEAKKLADEAAANAPATVTLSAAVLGGMQTELKALREEADNRIHLELRNFVTGAAAEGRITAAEIDTYVSMLSQGKGFIPASDLLANAKKHLGGIAVGHKVPVAPVGSTTALSASDADSAAAKVTETAAVSFLGLTRK